jgi:hypothetical protein
MSHYEGYAGYEDYEGYVWAAQSPGDVIVLNCEQRGPDTMALSFPSMSNLCFFFVSAINCAAPTWTSLCRSPVRARSAESPSLIKIFGLYY